MNREPQQAVALSLAALTAGLVGALFIPAHMVAYRVINGLFFGGMALLLYGLLRFVRRLGAFDLLLYSHKKLRQYSKRNLQRPEEEQVKLGSYHDYLLDREAPASPRLPLVLGAALVMASLLLTCVFYRA